MYKQYNIREHGLTVGQWTSVDTKNWTDFQLIHVTQIAEPVRISLATPVAISRKTQTQIAEPIRIPI